MSSFETQAAGLARPRSSPGPHLSIPLTRAPKAPLRSHSLPSSPGGPGEMRQKPPGSASARVGSPPASEHLETRRRPAPPPRASGKAAAQAEAREAQARGLGASTSEQCVCERRVGAQGVCVCRSPSPVWAPALSRAPESPLSRSSARAPTELRQGTS